MPALIVAAFAVSGATSLVLQVVWVRQLIDVFGSSSLAISTVLAAFMGGLALGSWLGGRAADRVAGRSLDPLWWYAGCEAVVGAAAFAIPLAVGHYRGANAWLWSRLGDAPALLALARFGLCGAALLVPTTAMGATLPLLSRRAAAAPEALGALGRHVGRLYAANTAGAVCGAAAAGFWLVPLFGVRATNAGAGAAALLLAGAVAAVASTWRRRAPALAGAPAPDVATAAAATPPDAAARRWAVAAFALSGAVAMSLEVLWSRALAIVIGSSVYSFSLVLVVFLVGIAAGAAWAAPRAARTERPLRALGLLLAGVAAATAVTAAITDDLPGLYVALAAGTGLDPGALLAVHLVVVGLAILPAALCLGGVMPFVIRAVAGRHDAVGRDVGRAYAFNTAGAIAGAFAGGFVVLPTLGLEGGLRAAVATDAALAAALLWRAGGRRRATWAAGAVAIAVAAVAAPGWDRSALTAGVFRAHVVERYIAAGGLFERPVLSYADGVSTTVSVEFGRGPILKNNGKVEASTIHDMPTQIRLGLLPVLLHGGDRQDVFVIGYGSGITVGAIAQSNAVRRIDVAELEPEVYRAADRFFGPYNHHPERDPRVQRHVGDGRNLLLAGDDRYDVIVSEPSNPWIAGVASLFSREFYALARRHLRDGGLFCQWAQLYELSPRTVKMIYRTFADAFPYVYAFTADAHSSDTFLIGSTRPLAIDLDRLHAAMRDPRVGPELARGGVVRAEDLAANLILAPDELPPFTAGADVNSDDAPQLEYRAPRDLMAAARRRLAMSEAIFADGWPYGRLAGIATGFGDGATRAARLRALARSLLEHGRRREARAWIDRARSAGAGVRDLAVLVDLTRVRTVDDPELPLATEDDPLPAPDPALFDPPDAVAAARLAQVYRLLAAGRWRDADRAARDLPRAAPTGAGRDVELVRAYAAFKAVRLAAARATLRPLVRDAAYAARRPAALYYYGRAHYGLGAFRDGVDALSRFARAAPGRAESLRR